MKLLIVDDSAMIRRSINSAYKETVFTEIETASDGLLALTIFKKFLPDVVTLDITMPHMDGLAAMSQMLEIKPNTIILVISALADHHTAIEALMRGAHQFICKPFSSEELKQALDTLLEENEKADTSDTINLPLVGKRKKIEEQVSTIPKPKTEIYPSGYVAPPTITSNRSISKDAVSRQLSINKGILGH